MVCGNTIMYVRIQARKPCISDRISMVCGNSMMLVRIQAWKPCILDRISMVSREISRALWRVSSRALMFKLQCCSVRLSLSRVIVQRTTTRWNFTRHSSILSAAQIFLLPIRRQRKCKPICLVLLPVVESGRSSGRGFPPSPKWR